MSDKSDKTKVLVTGGCGFIGNWLIRQLETASSGDYFPRAYDNQMWSTNLVPDMIIGDVRDEHSVFTWVEGFDVVVHMAAQINIDHSIQDIKTTFDINVMGTANIINACLKMEKKLVFVSSSEIYGSHDRPINEEHPLNGQSPYAASKIAADRLCYSAMRTWPNFDCTIVRPFNNYGPKQRSDGYGGVIAKFIEAALKDEPLLIYGDGNQSRDYTYVMDTVKALEMAIEGHMPKIFNVATGRTHSINHIAERILHLTSSKSEIVHVEPRLGEVQCLIGDATLARAYGWEPGTDFWDGLYQCVKYAKGERWDD